jgi:hypothetical protein
MYAANGFAYMLQQDGMLYVIELKMENRKQDEWIQQLKKNK